MGVAEQAYRKRDAKASMARQGGLRPNMRHVQRGSEPSRLSSTLLVKPNPVSRFPPSVIKDGWGGRSFCSDGLRSDINEDHAEHGPAQAYVVKGTKCAIALVAQLDRASDHGSGGCRFESCQGHLGREAIPLPNRLPAPHASVA